MTTTDKFVLFLQTFVSIREELANCGAQPLNQVQDRLGGSIRLTDASSLLVDEYRQQQISLAESNRDETDHRVTSYLDKYLQALLDFEWHVGENFLWYLGPSVENPKSWDYITSKNQRALEFVYKSKEMRKYIFIDGFVEALTTRIPDYLEKRLRIPSGDYINLGGRFTTPVGTVRMRPVVEKINDAIALIDSFHFDFLYREELELRLRILTALASEADAVSLLLSEFASESKTLLEFEKLMKHPAALLLSDRI